MNHGLDVLCSFAYHARTDLGVLREAVGPNHQVVVDSGAFTAHSRGKAISLDAYEEWLDRWRGTYDYAVTLDVIGNPEGTERNTARLLADGFDVVPVFTVGDEFDKLDRLADEGHALVYVGGLVGLPRRVMLPYLCSVAARARRRGIAVHALGVGGVTALRRSGVYSGDSSSATQSPTFGAVCVWTGQILNQVKVSDRAGLYRHREWLAGLGVPFQDLLTGNVFKQDQRPARDQVARAGLWAFVAASGVMRTRYPQHPAGMKRPGLRILAALSTGDIPLALQVAQQARTNPPPALSRIKVN